jgi:protease secretion system membrane fusion protein
MAEATQRRGFFGRLFGPPEPPPSDVEKLRDPNSAIAFGNAIIFGGFGLFLAWAAFAPLDEGVTTNGSVAIESMRKTISSVTGGSVGIIHVRENQQVKAGDILITFDKAKAQNTYDTLLQEYIAAAAKHARLAAESTLDTAVTFPEELVRLAEEAGRPDILEGQDRLFSIRHNAFNNELAVLRQTLASAQTQVAGVRQQVASKKQELALVTEELNNTQPLAEEGFLPKNKLLDLRRQHAAQSSSATELESRLSREISNSSEIQLRILQKRKDYLKEVESLAADANREASTLRERLDDARRELEKTELRSPVSGQVIALQAQTPGAAIVPGSKIMEIIPENEKLLLDVKIPPHLIDKIHPGLITHSRFAAFVDAPQLVVEGRVLSVSSDKHDVPGGTPPSYYLARVEVTEQGMKELHGRQMRPGMPVDVVVKTGERTLLAYLMKPIVRPLFNAFQEP